MAATEARTKNLADLYHLAPLDWDDVLQDRGLDRRGDGVCFVDRRGGDDVDVHVEVYRIGGHVLGSSPTGGAEWPCQGVSGAVAPFSA
jgi:hypothetical protein